MNTVMSVDEQINFGYFVFYAFYDMVCKDKDISKDVTRQPLKIHIGSTLYLFLPSFLIGEVHLKF